MDPLLLTALLTTARQVIAYIAARRGGDKSGAMEIIQSADLSAFNLDEEEMYLVNIAKSSLAYAAIRGVIIEESVKLIEQAEEREEDITPELVEVMLEQLDVELDTTEQMINEMED